MAGGVKLFVGGLSYGTTEDGLREAFAAYGSVLLASIVKDHETGKSRGFGFVEMENREEGLKALSMNGGHLEGRRITVEEARSRRPTAGGRPEQRGDGYRTTRW